MKENKMGLFRKLFSRKARAQNKSGDIEQETVSDFSDVLKQKKSTPEALDSAVISAVSGESIPPESDKSSNVNIWDMGDAESPEVSQPSQGTDSEAPSRPRRRIRNKTRILGFEPQDASVNDLLQANSDDTEVVKSTMVMNPTGLLVIINGPGRGASYPLFSGMANIGRGADQTIALDFGDTSISRNNHASIAYDSSDHVFYFGHGGKSNLVRMNGKPVLSTEVAKDGDEFLIGETTLRLMTICGPDFNWETTSEGDDDVAIA